MNGFTPPHVLSNMPENTPILLALSGGADSVALLDMLTDYCKRYHTPLAVAHVDHGIRGEESVRDREFCRALAERYGIPFYCRCVDVPRLAAERRTGLEEEAREVRYAFFGELMRQHSIPLLATAHNATDNAETMLFRMARGTGLTGLCGIPASRPLTEGLVIRPILSMTKDEILGYCREHSLDFMTDETNRDIGYSRNRIRHRILPELTELNADAVHHIAELSRSLCEDEAYIIKEVKKILEDEPPQGIRLSTLRTLPPALWHRALAMRFSTELSRVNRADIAELTARAIPHSRLDLPHGVTVGIENSVLCLIEKEAFTPLSEVVLQKGENTLAGGEMLLVIDKELTPCHTREFIQNIYKNSTTTHISFDTIIGSLSARARTAGDRILRGGHRKKLRKLQGEAGIPLPLREKLPLLCDGAGVLWAPLVGLRDGAEGEWRVTLFWDKHDNKKKGNPTGYEWQ